MSLEEYEKLISDFVEGRLPVEEFERQYWAAFISDPTFLGDEIFPILNYLCTSVDAYWPECQPHEETPFCITEQTLRRDAAECLTKLREYLRKHRDGQ